MLRFSFGQGFGAQGRRALRRTLWLGVFALALPLNLQASEQSAATSAEARAWLGRSCTVQGCAPPRSSAGIPLGFAGAVVLAGLIARRRGTSPGGSAPR
jgi:hypothetical protein